MSSTIDWVHREDLQLRLLQQGFASRIHLAKGNKEEQWEDLSRILNENAFAAYKAVKGPGYKKKFNSIVKAIKTKYGIDSPNVNLSGLNEVGTQLVRLALKIAKEVHDKQVFRIDAI